MSLFADNDAGTTPDSPSGKPSENSTPELAHTDGGYAAQTAHYDFNSASFGTQELFIGICGLIGAGKTTLAESLANKMNIPVYYEPVADNIYLEDFYADMRKYAFPLQIYLLNKRFKQQQQIVWYVCAPPDGIDYL